MPKEDSPIKILLIDIETAPMEAYVWQKSIYKTNIQPDQVKKDTHLMSFAAKWIDRDAMIYHDQSQKKDKSNDKELVQRIWNLLDSADVVIAHNGRAFDIGFINARLACWGMKPPSPFKVVDTYLVAKKHFGFTYNRLEYLARALGCKTKKMKHEKFAGLDLWIECLRNNKVAWEEMKKYNIADVVVLEEIYLKLRPYIVGHPNLGLYVNTVKPVCPNCGSENVNKEGFKAAQTRIYQQYSCKDCGAWSRGRDAIVPDGMGKQFHKKQLVN